MPDFEKLTINLTPVDLGRIELLVEQGFYANRTEFVRAAIHDQLEKNSHAIRESTAREKFVIGALVYDRRALEDRQKRGERLALRVIGLLSIEDDVSADLARATVESVKVHGVFKATAEVKSALGVA